MDLITEPGVYQLTDAEYHSDPVAGGSLSSTGAKRLLPPSCPAKFKWYQDHPIVKEEFEFGKAAHHAALGIGAEIMVLEYDSWRTKEAKEERDEIRAAGMVPLLQHDAQVVTEMAAALRAHPVAGRLFQPGKGVAEQALVWRDRQTGIMRRALLDWRQGHVVVDYKTTDKAEPYACARSIFNYQYHCQADWYLDGVGELGLTPQGKHAKFIFVFQEKTAPYLVTVVEPDQEALTWGGVLNAKAIDTFRYCTETGVWPGYAEDTDLVLASLPPYAITGYERGRQRGDFDTEGISIR